MGYVSSLFLFFDGRRDSFSVDTIETKKEPNFIKCFDFEKFCEEVYEVGNLSVMFPIYSCFTKLPTYLQKTNLDSQDQTPDTQLLGKRIRGKRQGRDENYKIGQML